MAEKQEQEQEQKPKKKHTGAYAKRKGNNYELKIIKELTALGYEGLKSSRSESKNLDADKIDIAETIPNTLPFYVQCKCTKNKPSYQDIIPNCPRKDRPLVIFHNYQVNKEVNMGSIGEYVIMTKEFFYDLIKATK